MPAMSQQGQAGPQPWDDSHDPPLEEAFQAVLSWLAAAGAPTWLPWGENKLLHKKIPINANFCLYPLPLAKPLLPLTPSSCLQEETASALPA